MRNLLTIDLEDYFHVSAFADRISAEDWNSHPSRLDGTTAKVLELLGARNVHATFFVLGCVAQQKPQVVRRIADAGHEIACHSLRHRLVYDMSQNEFREDTREAKARLEDACGKQVHGYRAPSFSITAASIWAFDILTELGFTYDSSIFPVEHPTYGMPKAPRSPFVLCASGGELVEFPMPTLELGGMRSPIGGGAYLRLLPYRYTRWGIRYINREERRPVCVYFHPWELDPEQPRMNGTLTARLRHRVGLRSTEAKLRKLMEDFEFDPLGSFVEALRQRTAPERLEARDLV